MKILVIGQGGREHAIVRALSHSPQVDKIHVIPGNDGMAHEAACHQLELRPEILAHFAKSEGFDLAIVGPEQPLADGVSDALRAVGLRVFAPGKAASRLESSKVFAKEFMKKAGAPTARYFEVNSVQAALTAAQSFAPPYVLKADGLCAGKGVVICKTLEDLKTAASDMFEKKILGPAGARALLEEFQQGWELSCHILTNGREYQILPFSQDHKRIADGDQGPNTGGMGVVGPLTVDPKLIESIKLKILDPVIAELNHSQMVYRGVLYLGLMITADGPQILEFNARFGDPETQVIMPLLKGDWAEVFSSVADGEIKQLQWKPIHVCAVVLASPGYPLNPEKGVKIEGDPLADTASSYFLHAGTKKIVDSWIVNGGRVLNAIGIGSTLSEAIKQAYAQSRKVNWRGLQMRSDIGKKVQSNGLH
jgi:phosphoribosylamine---glycine ligase